MRGAILGVIAVVILAALAYFFFVNKESKTQEPAATTTKTEEATPSAQSEGSSEGTAENNSITYTDSGFSPRGITIKSGESVTWLNNASSTVQVGSDAHPIHNNNREVTGGEFVIELAPGESRSVQLSRTGDWGYHDHLKSTMTGKITVQ